MPKHQKQTKIPHFAKAKNNRESHLRVCTPVSHEACKGAGPSTLGNMQILQFLSCLFGLIDLASIDV